MAIYVNSKNKVTNIFVNVNGEKKKIISAWADKNGVPTKVFSIDQENDYDIAPTDAINNWNYTLDNTNKIIILNYYIGSETDVIVYANYEINGVRYKTQIKNSLSSIMYTTQNFGYMFNGYYSSTKEKCSKIKSIKFSKNIDTSNLISMNLMFANCISLTDLDISNFDTSNVTDMASMFNNCNSLKTINVKNFNTENTTTMWAMFYACNSLTSLDLSNFDTSKVTRMDYMFANDKSMEEIIVSHDTWVLSKSSNSILQNCGVSLFTYTEPKNGHTYVNNICSICGKEKPADTSFDFSKITWSDGTDEEIAAMLEAHYNDEINIYDYWSVGDEREISLINLNSNLIYEPIADSISTLVPQQTITMVLLNKGGKILSNSINNHSECAFIAGTKIGGSVVTAITSTGSTLLQAYMNKNSMTDANWNDCSMRQWCNSSLRSSFLNNSINIFKSFYNETGTYSEVIDKTQDFFALPSEKEIIGTTHYASEYTEQNLKQFDYYKIEANRYYNHGVWLRSPATTISNSFCYISRGTENTFYSNRTQEVSFFGVI